jgi:hypothetical protein
MGRGGRTVLWFIVASCSFGVFYILYFLIAMPVFRRNGIVPELLRKGACFVNQDVAYLGQLLAAEGRSLLPYHVLVAARWVFYASVALFVVTAVRSC